MDEGLDRGSPRAAIDNDAFAERKKIHAEFFVPDFADRHAESGELLHLVLHSIAIGMLEPAAIDEEHVHIGFSGYWLDIFPLDKIHINFHII